MTKEHALAAVSGHHGAGSAYSRGDQYKVTVYGVGEPQFWGGRWEFRHFVCRIDWRGAARNGPAKDREVLARELPELGYRLVRGPDPVDQVTSEAVVRPVY